MERQPEASDAASSFSSQGRLAFEYSLKNCLWKQAAFFAERLVAERPCDETTYLLGLAYFHNQETARAQWHLQGNRLPEARYLLAKCCLLLKHYDQAEQALVMSSSPSGGCPDVVNGAAGLFLLGQVQEMQSRREQALECYTKCLELCPFMWDAYERWSWLVLGSPSPSRSSTSSLAPATFSDERFAQSFASLSASGQIGLPFAHAAPGPCRGGQERPAMHSSRSPPHRSQTAPSVQLSKGGLQSRRDRRDSNPGQSPKEATFSGRKSNSQAAVNQGSGSDSVSVSPQSQGELSLANLFCKLGLALHAMHSFDCQQTVQQLCSLPKRHYETGYVLDLVGLCHFETADYKKSEQAYQQAWKIEPRRMEGLEYYSSALWHLRKDVELGRLAQQCLQWDRLKPQVWCVVGNCCSLQKEHDAAIKFFKRAIQVDSSFTYAYTLCGHEFVASEKFDKAVAMYETALQADPRHYNAWWGLGNIYHRQEEHENAKHHFMKALQVNSSNAVLRCYLGMVHDALKQPLLALECFDQAAVCEPQNAMAYFHKACVLMSLDRFEEALADLKKVRTMAPKEPSVHFQLGKVYMKLQKDRKALFHFNIAMDLNRDSKDYHTIKTHIERLHIRGINEADSETASNAQASWPAQVLVTSRGATRQGYPPGPPGPAPVPTGSGSGSPVASTQYAGLSPPGAARVPPDVQPQTPATVRGGVQGSGGLWSAGASGSAGGAPRNGYPTGRGAGRGGSPSWSGTPGYQHGFRI